VRDAVIPWPGEAHETARVHHAHRILDFNVADDTILLDDAVFTALTPGALAAGQFVTGTAAGCQ